MRGETSETEDDSTSKKSSEDLRADEAHSSIHGSPLTPALSPPGRGRAVLGAIGITLAIGVISYVAIWACYGFRYAALPEAGYALDVAGQSPGSNLLPTIDRLHLLPQSYTFGLAYTLNSAAHRDNFLLGRISSVGHWYYFPIAMAVKTPFATIGLLLIAAFVLIRRRAAIGRHLWPVACLVIPAGVYLAMAMRSNLNIGLRHVLPIYPLAFVAIAVLAAKYRRLSTALLVVLLLETGSAFPNELSFFNEQIAMGRHPTMGYLSDSNLDWGQGLKALADWQAKNPTEKLYLSYFGTAPPEAYGVDATYVFAGYAYGPTPAPPTTPGVLAISITQLQGLYVNNEMKPMMEKIRTARLREVIGGSICLYDYPLKFGSR